MGRFGISFSWDMIRIMGFTMALIKSIVDKDLIYAKSHIYLVIVAYAPKCGIVSQPAQSLIHIGRPLSHKALVDGFTIRVGSAYRGHGNIVKVSPARPQEGHGFITAASAEPFDKAVTHCLGVDPITFVLPVLCCLGSGLLPLLLQIGLQRWLSLSNQSLWKGQGGGDGRGSQVLSLLFCNRAYAGAVLTVAAETHARQPKTIVTTGDVAKHASQTASVIHVGPSRWMLGLLFAACAPSVLPNRAPTAQDQFSITRPSVSAARKKQQRPQTTFAGAVWLEVWARNADPHELM